MSSLDSPRRKITPDAKQSISGERAYSPLPGKRMQLPAITAPLSKEYPDQREGRHSGKVFNRILRSFMISDILALHIGFIGAAALSALGHFIFSGTSSMGSSGLNLTGFGPFLTVSLGLVLWLQNSGHYSARVPIWMEARNIAVASCFALMANGFLQFVTQEDTSRFCLVGEWLIAGPAMIMLRSLLRSYFRRTGRWEVATLMVGQGATSHDTLVAMTSEPGLGYTIVGQIKDLSSSFLQAGRSWKKLCEEYNADYIVIALDADALANAQQPIAQLDRENIPFSLTIPLHHLPVSGMTPQYFFSHDILWFAKNAVPAKALSSFLKRSSDIFLSCLAVLLVSPLMLVLAAIVKRDGGPVFFGHTRIGRDGRKFSCLKFRSMLSDSESLLQKYLAEHPEAREEWAETHKLKNDPRVTWFGHFIRRTSLDELPQLLNVIKGDMSLVGPRPIVLSEIQKYESDIAYYYRVRPGITGLWQVSGRSDVSYPRRVRMDSWYVRNWSLWHDFSILCRTLPALLKRSGAY